MIGERFSSEYFEALGSASPEVNRLADELQGAIAEELLPELRSLAEKIAEALRKLGHRVDESEFVVDDDGAVCVGFVDTSYGSEPEHHRLRFDLDLIISVGYPGYEPSSPRAKLL
jgi:hypothetical protein